VSGGKQYIPLSDELKQVESYLRIQKRQYPDVFDFAIIADEDCADAETTKLVIQPLAENAIVHGFRDIDYRGFIEIAVHREGGVVTIEVADNGTGCDASELNLSLTCRERTSEFFAIQNVNLRIRDRYGEQYGLRYESSRDGLLAVITIPYVPISEENAC
jgi:two-component system sensor histidine kinase YesM